MLAIGGGGEPIVGGAAEVGGADEGKAAADLEFEEAARLRDEIRRLEADELGLPDAEKKAPILGHSTEGKPGTRKTRYGKQQQIRMGRRR